MDNKIKKCPHCGSDEGLYSVFKYKNVKGFYDYDGNFLEERFDYSYPEGGENLYCTNCKKYVCRRSKMED